MSSLKVQSGRGQPQTATVRAMPNELLAVHIPDPETNKIIKVNDISETRYMKVIAAGEFTGHYKGSLIDTGTIVVTDHATAGVAVPGIFHENKQLHRVDMRNVIATYEGE